MQVAIRFAGHRPHAFAVVDEGLVLFRKAGAFFGKGGDGEAVGFFRLRLRHLLCWDRCW
jgi:hypothetical protein